MFLFVLSYCYCQFQSGTSDCGLFALAYAAVLVKGDDSSKYVFDQGCMRKHIHQCLHSGKFSDFPIRRIGRRITKKTSFTFSVYCICRMPELPGGEMIKCNNCSEWFHIGICVKVSEEVRTKRSVPWYCNNCKQ